MDTNTIIIISTNITIAIGIIAVIITLHINQSKKIDAVNERITTFQIDSTNRITQLEINMNNRFNRIENKLNMPYSNGVLYNNNVNPSLEFEYPVSK